MIICIRLHKFPSLTSEMSYASDGKPMLWVQISSETMNRIRVAPFATTDM